jgi:hypothetical protein
MDAYLLRLGSNFNTENSKYVMRCILEAIDYGSRLIRSRTSRRKHANIRLGTIAIDDRNKHVDKTCSSGRCTISRMDSYRLGLMAFLSMMRSSSRRSRYSKIEKQLEFSYHDFLKRLTREESALILNCNSRIL